MEEKKFIGLKKNVLMGLTWLAFPVGIFALAFDHAKMKREDKLDIVQVFVFTVLMAIIGTVLAVIKLIFVAIFTAISEDVGAVVAVIFSVLLIIFAVAIGIINLVAMIKGFCHKYVQLPICYKLAGKFVKDNGAEVVEPSEEVHDNSKDNIE